MPSSLTAKQLPKRSLCNLSHQAANLPKEDTFQDSLAFAYSPHACIAEFLLPLHLLFLAKVVPSSCFGVLLKDCFVAVVNFGAQFLAGLRVVVDNERLLDLW
jgi:hypothetical protein